MTGIYCTFCKQLLFLILFKISKIKKLKYSIKNIINSHLQDTFPHKSQLKTFEKKFSKLSLAAFKICILGKTHVNFNFLGKIHVDVPIKHKI